MESAPAVVFLRDPGVKPVVYQGICPFLLCLIFLLLYKMIEVSYLIASYEMWLFAGPINSSMFIDLMENNKLHGMFVFFCLICILRRPKYNRVPSSYILWFQLLLQLNWSPAINFVFGLFSCDRICDFMA